MSNFITTTGILHNGVVVPRTRPDFDIKKILLTFWPKVKEKQSIINKKQALKNLTTANFQVSPEWADNKSKILDLHNPFE